MCKCCYLFIHVCETNSTTIIFNLISAPVGALQLTRNGRGARERLRPRAGPPRWGRGAFKGLVLAPTGPANTAHLPLQFYFRIISISKRRLAALAFASDKRRLRGRVEGWQNKGKGGRKRRAMRAKHFVC